jgi:hypothetical protein
VFRTPSLIWHRACNELDHTIHKPESDISSLTAALISRDSEAAFSASGLGGVRHDVGVTFTAGVPLAYAH